MSQQPQKQYAEPQVISRLSMWAPDPGSTAMERANMTFAKKGNNLEILVWPRNPTDKGKPPIRANLNITQIELLTAGLREAAATQDKFKLDIPINYGRKVKSEDNREKMEIFLQSTIRIARNSEGLICILLLDPDDTRARILFPMELDRWTGNLIRNGVPLTAAEMSNGVAIGYANILESIFRNCVEMNTREQNAERYSKATVDPNGRVPSGSQQRERGKTGFSDFDDDIPY